MKSKALVVLIGVVVVIAVFSIYYILNQDDLGRRGNLVGDGICGNYVKGADRDGCCAEVHSDDFTIECVGDWKYLSGIEFCQFVCDGTEPSCPEDVKVCDNQKIVERNASNECFFDEC